MLADKGRVLAPDTHADEPDIMNYKKSYTNIEVDPQLLADLIERVLALEAARRSLAEDLRAPDLLRPAFREGIKSFDARLAHAMAGVSGIESHLGRLGKQLVAQSRRPLLTVPPQAFLVQAVIQYCAKPRLTTDLYREIRRHVRASTDVIGWCIRKLADEGVIRNISGKWRPRHYVSELYRAPVLPFRPAQPFGRW